MAIIEVEEDVYNALMEELYALRASEQKLKETVEAQQVEVNTLVSATASMPLIEQEVVQLSTINQQLQSEVNQLKHLNAHINHVEAVVTRSASQRTRAAWEPSPTDTAEITALKNNVREERIKQLHAERLRLSNELLVLEAGSGGGGR